MSFLEELFLSCAQAHLSAPFFSPFMYPLDSGEDSALIFRKLGRRETTPPPLASVLS